jgi:AcrR family transcriptional regulator
MPEAPAVRRRMRGDDRRRQLLDAAMQIIVEHGAGAMSMERLAAAAGVSKALPYKHFENSEAVLAELYRRETNALGRRVWQALSEAGPDDDLIRLSLRVYFDEVSRRGPVLAALSAPGSTIPSVADAGGRAGVTFEVEVFNRFHGLDRERSKQVAGMIQGAVVGATDTWLAGHGTREQLEDDLVSMIKSLVRTRRPRRKADGDAEPSPGQRRASSRPRA